MKPSLVVPLLTALVGFGLGWLARPAADRATPSPPDTAVPPRQASAPSPPAPSPPAPSPPAPAVIPQRDIPAPPRLDGTVREIAAATAAERREKILEDKNAAKMLRLAEALGLSDAQQADLKKIISDNLRSTLASDPAPGAGAAAVLEQFAARGAALEKSLASLLTPEQRATFEDLRLRERDSRIETTAQRELANLSEVTDLSAAQREQVLAQLRVARATEIGAMPAALALILDSSVLPLGPVVPTAQSIQTLRQLAANQPADASSDLHATLIEAKRRQLDEQLKLLKDILTPAQLAQYRATIAEQQAIHDMMIPPPR
jgi:hypothetical protein